MEYGLRQDGVVTIGSFSKVLILILLEYGLRQNRKINHGKERGKVLILILLEYGLRLGLTKLTEHELFRS